MASLKEQGIRAFIWDFTGKLSTQGMGFIVSIFLARLLEPADFGLVAIVMVVVGIAGVFTDIGLGGALIQRRKLHPVHYASVFYFNIIVASVLAVITFFSAPVISTFYENAHLLPIIHAMSFLFIFNALGSVQSIRLRKALNYALITKISLLSSLISGVLGVSLAFGGAGVWSLVVQILSMGAIGSTLLWWFGGWHPSLTFSGRALVQLWAFGFRMFLSALLDNIYSRLDFLIIGKLFPVVTLGYFQRAKSLNGMIVQYSSGSLMSVLFPILSKVQKDLPRFQNIVLKALGLISFLVFLLVGGFYLVGKEVIVLLFSEKWLPSVGFFQILVLSGFAFPISALLVNVLGSRGNSKDFLRLEIYKKLVASVNLVVLLLFGIDAFLYGLIVQGFFGVGLNIIFASREISLSITDFIKPIIVQMSIAIVATFLTLFVIVPLHTGIISGILLKGSLFTLLYLYFSYLLKTSGFMYFMEQIAPFKKKIGISGNKKNVS